MLRKITRLAYTLLIATAIATAIAACDMPDLARPLCEQLGGEYEMRPHPEHAQATTGYCVFADAEGCFASQLLDGSCAPPGADWAASPLATPTTPQEVGNAYVLVGPPQTLEMLVAQAPLIVIGEIGPIEQYLDFAVYGSDGALIERDKDPAGNLLPEAPATDFLVLVEEVLRDDGTVAKGEAIILRMPGIATEEMKQLTAQTDYPFSYTGDRHLFLLTPNPDGASYGFYYGAWSRLIVEDEMLRVSNGQQQPLQFADTPTPITLDELMDFVQNKDGL